jgi:hypothetical protein
MKYPRLGGGGFRAKRSRMVLGPDGPTSPDSLRQDARLKQLAADIHLLGAQPLHELFLELAQGADLYDTLERYARLVPLAAHILRQPAQRSIHLRIAGVSL